MKGFKASDVLGWVIITKKKGLGASDVLGWVMVTKGLKATDVIRINNHKKNKRPKASDVL